MSKSLNQAFIKAYSKEQAGLAKQQVTDKSSVSQVADFRIEDFIVRFDTATCVIPSHQAAASQKPKIAASSLSSLPLPSVVPPPARSPRATAGSVVELPVPAAVAPRPTATSAAAMSTSGATVLNLSRRGRGQSVETRPVVSHREQELAAERRAAEDLRNTIASQMSRAGSWEAQQIDALDVGFPMVSAYHQRRGQTNGEPQRNVPNSSPASGREPSREELVRPPHQHQQPVHQQPVHQQPVHQQPVHQKPVKQHPEYQQQRAQPTSGAQQSQLQGPHFGAAADRGSAVSVAARTQATNHQAAQTSRIQPDAQQRSGRVQVVTSEQAEQRAEYITGTRPPVTSPLRSDSHDNPHERSQSPQPAPRITPLESPALSPQAVQQQQAAMAAQLNRTARVQDCGGQGEIFRLDRPTYHHRPDGPDRVDYADSDDLSSEVLGLSASGTNVDIETLISRHEDRQRPTAETHRRVDRPEPSREPMQEATSNPRPPRVDPLTADNPAASVSPASDSPSVSAARPAAANHSTASSSTTTPAGKAGRDWPAKSLEHDLRRAKVRIFNPVWEVDSFQWPDICLELLQQRAEAMELVARNLIEACQEGLQVLAVTSPHSGEGRTTVACCLAKLAGSRGLNVAIVDGDIDNPTLSFQTNLELEQDWKTAIFNQLPLEEVAVHSIEDQVTLVPLVQPIHRDEMALDDNRIEFMLQELSASFDLVIVDMGHMESSRSLVTSLGERGVISAVVAVVDYRSSTRQEVDHCLQRIRQTGISSIGLVENFAA